MLRATDIIGFIYQYSVWEMSLCFVLAGRRQNVAVVSSWMDTKRATIEPQG